MRTWVMEDNVGDIVGENCLGCCRLQSPATGRDRGLSGTRRRGEVAAKEPPSPEGRLGLLGEDWRGWLRGDVGSEGLESEEDREEGRDWLEREEGMEELLWEDWSEGLLREAWSEGLRREAWRLGLLREDCRDGLLRELCRGEGSPVGTKTESTVTPPARPHAPGRPGRGSQGDGGGWSDQNDGDGHSDGHTHPGQGDSGVRGHRGSSQTPARPLTPSDPTEREPGSPQAPTVPLDPPEQEGNTPRHPQIHRIPSPPRSQTAEPPSQTGIPGAADCCRSCPGTPGGHLRVPPHAGQGVPIFSGHWPGALCVPHSSSQPRDRLWPLRVPPVWGGVPAHLGGRSPARRRRCR